MKSQSLCGTQWVRRAGLVLALLLAAACGQKAGVGDDGGAAIPAYAPAPTALDPAETAYTPAEAEPLETPTLEPQPSSAAAPALATPPPRTAAKPVAGQTATTAGTARATAAAASAPAAPASPAPAQAPAPSGGPTAGPAPTAPAAPGGAAVDRRGVSDKLIKIGVHAPITGAAPLPQNAFDKGKDVYWKWLNARGGLFGRSVEIIFRDDQFNPSRAVQVCRELVEQAKVFALFGVAGSDQITACGRYAESAGVPYLAPGVNEDGLDGLKHYFAVSQTYPQQHPTITSLVKNKLGKTKIAIVLNQTPALDQTQRHITATAQAAGLQIVRQSRITKSASDSELLSEANQLRASGAEAVYIITAPVNFIKLATNAYAQAYSPIWTGPGLTNGINIVTEAGCPAVNNARFLSPFPQLDVIDQLDADYRPAYRKFNDNAEPDDIGLAEWGLNKTLHKMLEAAGPDLSRESFLAALESGREFNSNVFPTVRYDGSLRFGASSMHVLRADCSDRKWKTETPFATGF